MPNRFRAKVAGARHRIFISVPDCKLVWWGARSGQLAVVLNASKLSRASNSFSHAHSRRPFSQAPLLGSLPRHVLLGGSTILKHSFLTLHRYQAIVARHNAGKKGGNILVQCS